MSQFLVWLDEEMCTGGLGPSRVRVEEDGVSRVVVENYGWRRSDPLDHRRLRSAAGPLGWYGGGTDD